ncbi:hypothetical protein [Planomonospora sp. ID82291]|uniref:hypothetical protein n=1 Tax=Planomonospora sp. ID82291 TaxID=2738136 RepID=UPI0018C40789|nr:hypothetical protein [Planomonospora sp. ID82291]MBG0818988.1 hypothetical protein [Planomonospora sp. ID82291]
MSQEQTERRPPSRKRTNRGGSHAGEAFDALDRAKQQFAGLAIGDGLTGGAEPGALPDVALLQGTVVSKPQPAFDVPSGPQYQPAPENASPSEQLAHYERIIGGANEVREAARSRVERYWAQTAGRSLLEIRDGKLYEEYGNYKSFMEYVEDRWQISRQHAYRAMQAVPVHLALPEVDRLSFRQIEILARLGAAAVIRQVWEKAEANNDTSPAGLKAVVAELEVQLNPAEERPQLEPSKPKADPLQVVEKALEDLPTLRRITMEAPERARALAQKFRAAAEEIEADLSGDG